MAVTTWNIRFSLQSHVVSYPFTLESSKLAMAVRSIRTSTFLSGPSCAAFSLFSYQTIANGTCIFISSGEPLDWTRHSCLACDKGFYLPAQGKVAACAALICSQGVWLYWRDGSQSNHMDERVQGRVGRCSYSGNSLETWQAMARGENTKYFVLDRHLVNERGKG